MRSRSTNERLTGVLGRSGPVLGIAVAAAYVAWRLRRDRRPEEAEHVKAAITVRKPRQEVHDFWREHEELHRFVGDGGAVRFVDAPRNRGTEVHVELDRGVPGGKLGEAAAMLSGEGPTEKAKDDLRRFKQMMEAGEVARTDPGQPRPHEEAS